MKNLNNINNTLRSELIDRINNTINDCFDDDATDFSELHFHAFNESYYITGYYDAEQWMKTRDISAFDAINFINEYNQDNFGSSYFNAEKEINAENVVNMLTYILGEQIIYSLFDDLEDTSKTELLGNI